MQNDNARSTGSQSVTVACKLPHGLVMRVFDMVKTDEPMYGGGFKTIEQARERSDRVIINGNSHPQNEAPGCQIVGGYALTYGVDKSFWELWIKQNASSAMVKNKLIFAHEGLKNAEAEAKEKDGVRSGLERLDPKKLPKGLQISEDTPSEIKKKIDA